MTTQVRITITWKSGAKLKMVRKVARNPDDVYASTYTAAKIIDLYLNYDFSQVRKITVKPYTGN